MREEAKEKLVRLLDFGDTDTSTGYVGVSGDNVDADNAHFFQNLGTAILLEQIGRSASPIIACCVCLDKDFTNKEFIKWMLAEDGSFPDKFRNVGCGWDGDIFDEEGLALDDIKVIRLWTPCTFGRFVHVDINVNGKRDWFKEFIKATKTVDPQKDSLKFMRDFGMSDRFLRDKARAYITYIKEIMEKFVSDNKNVLT